MEVIAMADALEPATENERLTKALHEMGGCIFDLKRAISVMREISTLHLLSSEDEWAETLEVFRETGKLPSNWRIIVMDDESDDQLQYMQRHVGLLADSLCEKFNLVMYPKPQQA